MTLPATNRRAGPFAGDSDQTDFPFSFKIFAATDIAVAVVNFAGVETVLTYGTDYNVTVNSNQDSSPGGSVTYPLTGSPLPAGSSLVVYGALPYDQPLDLPTGGNFSPLAIENEHDRTVMQIQQLREVTDRSLRVPVTSDSSTELPTPEEGTVLGWDSDGNIANLSGADLAGDLVYVDWIYETFAGDGATTTFTLLEDPGVIANTLVSVDGLLQAPTLDYTLGGNVLTFTTAPADEAVIVVRYAQAVGQTVVMQTLHRITATAGQTTFTIGGGYLPGQGALAVYVNGLRVDGAGIDYTETDANTVTFTSGLSAGDVAVFVAGTEALGGGSGSGTSGALRIVVVGDSLSATNGMTNDSWPALLETRLNSLGMNVEVLNLALNGWTFNKANTTVSYGTQTVLARAVALRPDIVIAALGAADAVLNVEARNQTQIRSDAATFFSSLKAALPNVATVYAREVMFDEALFPSAASLKNKAVSPYFQKAKSSGILANCYCSEILDDAIDSTQQTKFTSWVSFDGYVSGLADVDATMDLPYFKAARLGLTGVDGLHLNDMGQHYVVGAIIDGLRAATATLAPYLDRLGDQNYVPWNDPDYVFDAFLTPSGDGYVAASYDSQVYQLSKHGGLWGQIQPDTWHFPSKATARIGNEDGTVPADSLNLVWWQVVNARPNTEVEVSVNGAAFAPSGMTTDAYGSAFFPAIAGQLAAGSYELRYRAANEVFGPFAVTLIAATEPTFYGRNVGTTNATGGSDTYTKVLFDEQGSNGGWDSGASTYTAPRAGRYQVSSNVALEDLPSNGAIMASIYVNGSRRFEGPLMYNGSGATAVISAGVSAGVWLDEDDTVEIYVYQYLGGVLNTTPGAATASTWLTIDWLGFNGGSFAPV